MTNLFNKIFGCNKLIFGLENKFFNRLTLISLVISLFIGVGFFFAYRFPISFMLRALYLYTYYPLFNAIIAIIALLVMPSQLVSGLPM